MYYFIKEEILNKLLPLLAEFIRQPFLFVLKYPHYCANAITLFCIYDIGYQNILHAKHARSFYDSFIWALGYLLAYIDFKHLIILKIWAKFVIYITGCYTLGTDIILKIIYIYVTLIYDKTTAIAIAYKWYIQLEFNAGVSFETFQTYNPLQVTSYTWKANYYLPFIGMVDPLTFVILIQLIGLALRFIILPILFRILDEITEMIVIVLGPSYKIFKKTYLIPLLRRVFFYYSRLVVILSKIYKKISLIIIIIITIIIITEALLILFG